MSAQNHNKQKVSQIFFPFLLAILLTAAAAYFLFRGFSTASLDPRVWANISAVLIIIPVFICFIITFLFLVIIILLTQRTHTFLASQLPQLNVITERINTIMGKITGTAVKPFLMSESVLAILGGASKENNEQENNE